MGLLTHVEAEIEAIVIKVLEKLDLYHAPAAPATPAAPVAEPSPTVGGTAASPSETTEAK